MTDTATSTNGNGNGNGSTASKALDALMKYGPGTCIAVYLVWVLAAKVLGGQDATTALITSHVKEASDHARTTDEINGNLKSILVINRLSCIHAAKTDAEKADCAKQ